MKHLLVLLFVLVIAGLAAGCAGAPPTPSPVPAQPGEGPPGPVYVEETDLLLLESYPVQVRLVVRGNLPTPCHQARWEVSGPDDSGRIDVELYSTAPEDRACIQVLASFEEDIPLGSHERGQFTVWLNGEQVQAFQLP
ncbi:MAG: hypothetical protein AB1449_09840 [Chloroflexota bacterium]